VLLVAGGGESGADVPVPQAHYELGATGEDTKVPPPGELQELLLLALPERFSMALLGFISQNGRYQLVAALADFHLDPVDRHVIAQALERPPPCLNVGWIGVDQCAIDVKNDSVYWHCLR
jgi:hypothetical protein